MKRGDWTWLELTKICLGILTPLTLFYLSFAVGQAVRDADEQIRNDAAVQEFARDIYGRRVHAELLASGLRRHAADPTETSLAEVIERKRAYDQAYVQWNTKSQSNLLVIRRLLESDVYTNLEAIVDRHLVAAGFAPLDACLTEAYDAAVRNRIPYPTRDTCDVPGLLHFVLLCGSAITDELSRTSYDNTELASSDVLLRGRIAQACGVPNVGGRFHGYARP